MKTIINSKILISTHKEFISPEIDLYIPIHAGKIISDLKLNYQGDNTGENISHKNPSYAELTTIYWAWKNLKDINYIGICHYRRYFLFNKFLKNKLKLFTYNAKELFTLKGVLNFDDSLLRKHDFILAEPINSKRSIYEDYAINHSKHDFDILGEVIKELESEYYNSFKELVYNTSCLSPFNMFVTTKDNFNRYCDWLFPILFETEKRIKISNDNYQIRVFGFMGERLLNLYVYHNKFKVKYLPVIKVDEEVHFHPLRNKFPKFILRIVNNLIN
jgi:hypothetical protein